MENLPFWGCPWGKRGEGVGEKLAKNKNCKILRVCNNLSKSEWKAPSFSYGDEHGGGFSHLEECLSKNSQNAYN